MISGYFFLLSGDGVFFLLADLELIDLDEDLHEEGALDVQIIL